MLTIIFVMFKLVETSLFETLHRVYAGHGRSTPGNTKCFSVLLIYLFKIDFHCSNILSVAPILFLAISNALFPVFFL